jgi:hypothetical protein
MGAADPAALATGQVEIEGTYTLTSTSANAPAHAPIGGEYTAFTGALLKTLKEGIPNGPQLLTLDEIYRNLRRELRARNAPSPERRGVNNAGDLALAINPAFGQTDDVTVDDPTEVEPQKIGQEVRGIPASPATSRKDAKAKLSATAKSRTIAAAVLLVVMAVAVVVIVGSQSSSRGGSASPTSTNESTRKLDPRLRAMLPSGDGCGVLLKNSDLPDAAMAGASCHPNVSGSLVTSLDYWLFADQGSLDSWVTQPPATGFQPCPGRGPSPQDWHSTWNPQLQGKIVCFVDDGEPYVRWSINSQLLFGQASGVYLDSLYHWWAARYQP